MMMMVMDMMVMMIFVVMMMMYDDNEYDLNLPTTSLSEYQEQVDLALLS
jgi:biopolymer transport protein ExbD